MDFFSLLSMLGFANELKSFTRPRPRKPSRLKNEIDELYSDLDYFTNIFTNFTKRNR